jgi:hypothetical protein
MMYDTKDARFKLKRDIEAFVKKSWTVDSAQRKPVPSKP